MKIQIESGIPCPPRGYQLKRWEAELKSMKVDQSFLVDTENERNCILMAAKRHGVSVTTRKDEKGKGWRIWRIK